MKSYGLVGWCALVFSFLVQIASLSILSGKPGLEVLLDGVLIFLPLIILLILEVKKDFKIAPIFGEQHRVVIIGILFGLALLLYKFKLSVDMFLLLFFVISAFILGVNSQAAFAVALVFLAFCPLLLLVQYQKQAEIFAVYTYYFLVIGVVLEIRDAIFAKKTLSDDVVKDIQKSTREIPV